LDLMESHTEDWDGDSATIRDGEMRGKCDWE
jgi:hypothetical protein